MIVLPDSPDELLNRLFTMFPRFKANYDGPIFDQPLSYDSVLTAFTSDFGLEFPNSSDDQLHDFAALVNAAVAHGGRARACVLAVLPRSCPADTSRATTLALSVTRSA
jgi:hypothetical protein